MKKIFSFLTAVLFAGSMMATTVSKTVEELATAKSWENSAVVTPFNLDEVIAVSTTATDANTGKYYSNGQQIRLYQSGNASITLTAVEGYTISSVTLTYASQNSGILNEAESGVAVPFENVQSATFTVGNSGAATNGQARITAFSVTYDGEGGGEEPTMAYYVAGSMTNWGPMAAYKLAANPANEGEYMGEFTFAANDEFKVGYSDGITIESTNYFPNGIDNNYVITEAGDYTVYFRPDGQGGEGWHYGVIYAAKKEAPADPTNCAEAAAAALSVSANNELYNNGAVYTITGYVTSIKTAYSDQFHNISFWMADAVDGGEVLQAFRAACASEADAPAVGDKVAVTGTLTKYNTTPEFSADCTFEILEHAAPTADYFLVGTNNGWDGSNFLFAANPKVAGEYMLDVEFEAGDEFKVIGVLEGDTTWYPEGMDNNYIINEAGEYTVYFRPVFNEEWQNFYTAILKEDPEVDVYDVAEAIAAGLAEDTEIMVRGVVTKITFKGTNFVKYGSANIYVADATGAEGEFQFFNCYSFDADTFRMSDPEYDATSAQAEEFQMVADDNGNAVYVGDTIIAFGKYKLYGTTHELNTGCYIVDVIPGEGGGEETIGYDYEPTEASQFSVVIDSIKVEDYTADYGVVALALEDAAGNYFASLEYLTSKYDEKVGIPAGTYQISDSEAEGTFYASPGGDEELDYGCYFGVVDEGGEYYTPYYMVSGTVTISADGSMLVKATSYFGSTIKLVYGNPKEAVENTKVADNKVIKFIEAGKVVIRKNGVKYNVVGQMMK